MALSNDDQMNQLLPRFDALELRVTKVEDRLKPLEDIARSLREIVRLMKMVITAGKWMGWVMGVIGFLTFVFKLVQHYH